MLPSWELRSQELLPPSPGPSHLWKSQDWPGSPPLAASCLCTGRCWLRKSRVGRDEPNLYYFDCAQSRQTRFESGDFARRFKTQKECYTENVVQRAKAMGFTLRVTTLILATVLVTLSAAANAHHRHGARG